MSRQIILAVGALALIVLLGAPLYLAPFSITLRNYIGVYSLIALGLVLLTGNAGMVSFGQASFMGIAAYATGWTSAVMGYSPWLGLILALVLTGLIAAILGAVTLRLGGHFLSLSTIAWGLAIYFSFGNIPGLGAFDGIPSLPPISIGGVALVESGQIFYLIWVALLLSMLAVHNMLDSRVGRALRALRGGNALVESLGVNALQVRLATFVIAALCAALSGWLYAHMGRFVSPTPFDVTMSIMFLMMAMIGGSGYLLGAVVGAAIINLLKNGNQDVLPRIAPGASGQLEVVVFASLFILFLQRARNGIVPFIAQWIPEPHRERPPQAEPLPRQPQPAKDTALMQVDAVSRRFGGLIAVNDVSFEVRAGEILALIGPNGAGKTTMFNLITGALPPSGGRIVFAGKDITKAGAGDVAGASFGDVLADEDDAAATRRQRAGDQDEHRRLAGAV